MIMMAVAAAAAAAAAECIGPSKGDGMGQGGDCTRGLRNFFDLHISCLFGVGFLHRYHHHHRVPFSTDANTHTDSHHPLPSYTQIADSPPFFPSHPSSAVDELGIGEPKNNQLYFL